MLSKTQLVTMLDLQGQMNTKVNEEWLKSGYAYLRAAMIESVEAIEHHGWKWWKAQHLDLPQVQMELVDIWHFALSHLLIMHNGNQQDAAIEIEKELKSENTALFFDGKAIEYSQQSLVENLELLAGLCAAKRFDVPLFMYLVSQADMTADSLFEQYVGKNILNFFRQDNGYKAGTYIKIWQGKEDNEHLVEVLASTDQKSTNYAADVYSSLQRRYLAAD